MKNAQSDTIVALATAHGSAAIAVIRLSGTKSISIVDSFLFDRRLKKMSLKEKKNRQVIFGVLMHQQVVVDEVLVTKFVSPHSYTGEDSVEVSCHGSPFIQQQILQLFIHGGARMADRGEFTMRAFLNGKMDLAQAEAVADLVSSKSPLSHQIAMQHMRGGYSSTIKTLRDNLINFASLIELELDFSEEDVEFADRKDLKALITRIISVIEKLIGSFDLGNVIKSGVPVAIVGRPNAGKSTLLNVLLEDDRAIVSDIAGTTRDTIEDEVTMDGVLFRFIDTAGLRSTSDIIEQIGVNKALEAIRKSAIVIYLFDVHTMSCGDIHSELAQLKEAIGNSQVLLVANKIDMENIAELKEEFSEFRNMLYVSAKEQLNIDHLKKSLVAIFDTRTLDTSESIVTNARHAGALRNAATALEQVKQGLESNIQSDFLALDIKHALEELGHITGEVTNEDLLDNIFTKFCIGK